MVEQSEHWTTAPGRGLYVKVVLVWLLRVEEVGVGQNWKRSDQVWKAPQGGGATPQTMAAILLDLKIAPLPPQGHNPGDYMVAFPLPPPLGGGDF